MEALMNHYLPILVVTVTLGAATPVAQQQVKPPFLDPALVPGLEGAERPAVALPDGPQVLTDSAGQPFRVVPIKGLRTPWALAFLPSGEILVTELRGQLRIIRNGVLDPRPIAGGPEVTTRFFRAGLMDVALHPRYAENKFIYFTYSKAAPANPDDTTDRKPAGNREAMAVALARARLDGSTALTDVKDIFVSDARCQAACASRIAFARDGTIIMTIGKAGGDDPQNPATHWGKVLRL